MNKNLLKTFLVAVGLAVGVSGAWAQAYVTTTVNAEDPTKQDVTYILNDAENYADGGVTVDETEAVGSVYNGTDFTNLYPCNTPGLDRLAFNAAAGTGMKGGKWWWRFGTGYGVQLRRNGQGGVAVTDLKAGDKVVIFGVALNDGTDQMTFSFPGASSVDGTTQTPKKGDGEADFTVTRVFDGNNATITINVTSDGYAAAFVLAYNYGYIQKVVITEDMPAAAVPTGSITKVDGVSRIISLATTTANAQIHYTTDGTIPTAESTLYDAAKGIVISENTTIKAVTVTNDATSAVYTQEFEAGTAVTLNAPAVEKTAWADGMATYNISDNQESVLLEPATTIKCTSDESVEIVNGTVTLAPGHYTFASTATGYENGVLELDVIADRKLDVLESYDYVELVADFEDKQQLQKGTEVEYTEGRREYVPFAYDATAYSEEKRDVKLLVEKKNLTFSARTGRGIQNGHTGDRYFAIKDLKAGQIVRINCGNLEGRPIGITPMETDRASMANEATLSMPVIEVLQDGTVALKIGRATVISSIEICEVNTDIVKTIPAESGYASFSADKAVTVPEDVTVYKAAVSAEGDAIVLTPVDTEVIPANTGVLLYSETAGDKVFYTATEAADADFSGNELIATSVEAYATVPTGGTYYALKAGVAEFAVINGGVVLSANKAYIKAPENSEAKPMRMVIGGQTTGINEVDAADGAADGAYYTLQGVKVENPTKGLYIHNGKKVIIK